MLIASLLLLLFSLPILSMDNPNESIKPTNHQLHAILSLRELCLNALVKDAQTDSKCNLKALAHLPHELAEPLLEKCKEQICVSVLVGNLPGQGKISPDGSKILIAAPDYGALQIYSTATAALLATLEESITSDNQKPAGFTNTRLKYKWSNAGNYLYCSYFTPSSDQTTYTIKVWDSDGKKSYQLSSGPCRTLYFSPTDKYLLCKEVNKPLEVYHAATGTPAAILGEPSYYYSRRPQDPHAQWLSADGQDGTRLYDSSTFAPIRSLPGIIKYWSRDGNLFALKLEEDTGQIIAADESDFMWGGNGQSHRVTKSYAIIYNRLFEILTKVPFGNHMHSIAISPDNRFLTNYSGEYQECYSLATGQKINEIAHYHSDNHRTFSDLAGNYLIQLTKKHTTTELCLTSKVFSQKIVCEGELDGIYYTKIPHLIAFAKHDKIRYLLNPKIGILIPCNVEVKYTFKLKPSKAFSAAGYYITKEGRQNVLRRLIIHEKLTPLIKMLSHKLESETGKRKQAGILNNCIDHTILLFSFYGLFENKRFSYLRR